jgi:hypothetical protein
MSVYEEEAIPEDEKRCKKAGCVVKQGGWICGVLRNGAYIYVPRGVEWPRFFPWTHQTQNRAVGLRLDE